MEMLVDLGPHAGGCRDGEELVELLHHLQRCGDQVLVAHQAVYRVRQSAAKLQVVCRGPVSFAVSNKLFDLKFLLSC